MKPFYVDENDNTYLGEEAEERLRGRNDLRFFRQREGVLEVDQTRWKQAQQYERRTWMEAGGLAAREDRNTEHEIHFDHYAAIAGSKFESALEIGCGPFTNLARVLGHVTAKRVTLLDPLINDYVQHPNCSYRSGTLAGTPATLVPQPIEGFETSDKFDLVVMINVLEHCYSLPRVFERIDSLVALGGVLVFHDKLIPASSIDDFVQNIFDAGHPIRVADEVILRFLQGYQELYSKHVEIPLEDYMAYTFDSLYFIGRKSPRAS
jgi:SAM-dependent methyltransferase